MLVIDCLVNQYFYQDDRDLDYLPNDVPIHDFDDDVKTDDGFSESEPDGFYPNSLGLENELTLIDYNPIHRDKQHNRSLIDITNNLSEIKLDVSAFEIAIF
ncbi:hypothetical protein BpHYR1_050406 [Brachionus plicatilis]|uniref:Uncharacterized protein n=1 Tax=Brachionus plicatilis TaxID=10195 RepID=A0A3M7SC82_BRAPC|nr:hypothetical protein BpHYR1_050406 [Brachionus plicatilis]